MLTLDGLQQRRNMSSDSYECLAKGFAEATSKHKIQLVVQELGEIGANSLRQHPNTLKDRLFG